MPPGPAAKPVWHVRQESFRSRRHPPGKPKVPLVVMPTPTGRPKAPLVVMPTPTGKPKVPSRSCRYPPANRKHPSWSCRHPPADPKHCGASRGQGSKWLETEAARSQRQQSVCGPVGVYAPEPTA